eukprot:81540-Rhodomonas_salina.1
MPGTDLAYRIAPLRVCYAVPSTDLAHGASSVRARYAARAMHRFRVQPSLSAPTLTTAQVTLARP